MLVWLLKGSGLFQVKEISIEGGERVKPAEAEGLIGIRVGENIFAADLGRARDLLLRLPWVRQVQVRRVLPAKIVVVLEERKPHAIVSLGEEYRWVDREGYLLDRATTAETVKPLLSGARATETDRGRRLDDRSLLAFQTLLEMGGDFLDRFSEFHLQSGSPELVLHAREGFRVMLDLEGLRERLELLVRLLTVIDGSHYLYIDLRFGDLVLLPR